MRSIKIKNELRPKNEQGTLLTGALREALSILEMPVMDLAKWLQQQIEQNPALQFEEEKAGEGEESEGEEEFSNPFESFSSDDAPRLEPGIEPGLEEVPAPPQTLFNYLLQQAREVLTAPEDLKEMEQLIGNLDEKGFLADSSNVNPALLKILQSFDPPGIGAQNLQHSLLLQLVQKGEKESLAYRLIQDHFQDFIHCRGNLPGTPSELRKAIEILAGLSLDPAAPFKAPVAPTQIPDIFIESSNEGWMITLNDAPLPRFKLNLAAQLSHFEASARWIEKMVSRRSEIVRSIVKIVLEVQDDFFQGKTSDLYPLSFKQLAEKLSLHESTICRAVKEKILSCPRGIYSLRFFFPHTSTHAVSHHTAKERIKALLAQEDKEHPFSDQQLTEALHAQGVPCARRTITKYRKALKIPPACRRKARVNLC